MQAEPPDEPQGPTGKVVPDDDESPDSFGVLGGTVDYQGDIVAPDPEGWDKRPD